MLIHLGSQNSIVMLTLNIIWSLKKHMLRFLRILYVFPCMMMTPMPRCDE